MSEVLPIIVIIISTLSLIIAFLIYKKVQSFETTSNNDLLLKSFTDLIDRLDKSFKDEFSRNRNEFSNSTKSQREELNNSLKLISDQLTSRLDSLTKTNEDKFDKLQERVSSNLKDIQENNSKKLEEMRVTVDEKLHSTLEKRLGDSFKIVSERLELVHKGLGEMQNLATGVGDLKRVLTNVKNPRYLG